MFDLYIGQPTEDAMPKETREAEAISGDSLTFSALLAVLLADPDVALFDLPYAAASAHMPLVVDIAIEQGFDAAIDALRSEIQRIESAGSAIHPALYGSHANAWQLH